jgi:hypothetical protein
LGPATLAIPLTEIPPIFLATSGPITGQDPTALEARLLNCGASGFGVEASDLRVAVEVRCRKGQLVEYRAMDVM